MLLVPSITLFSKDLFVEPLGLAPAYSTISAALAAAEHGDDIFIDNGVSNIPFGEDITINKSVNLFNIKEGEFFELNGNVNIDLTGGDLTVGIHNMDLMKDGGYITVTREALVSSTINVISCKVNGTISLIGKGVIANVVGCQTLEGRVSLSHGSVIGSQITYNVNSSAVNIYGYTDDELHDTVRIIGNKILGGHDNSIRGASSQVNYVIKNNYIKSTYNGTIVLSLVSYQGSSFVNEIVNNTINVTTARGILVSSTNKCLVENNVINDKSNANYASIATGETSIVSYNVISTNFSNTISGSLFISQNRKRSFASAINSIATPVEAVDLGNPSPVYYDLDLTVADAGAYGGSLSLANFFPLFEGKSKVFFVDSPRIIREGDPVFIQAEAFDR